MYRSNVVDAAVLYESDDGIDLSVNKLCHYLSFASKHFV